MKHVELMKLAQIWFKANETAKVYKAIYKYKPFEDKNAIRQNLC